MSYRILGYRDAAGYIYVVDRKNNMIITGGENVYPAQVEKILSEHDQIFEAAVFGIPDDTWGEAVKAVVVLQPGAALTAEALIDYCRDKMANYAKPKYVEFVDQLPHFPTGKIDKLTIRKQHLIPQRFIGR